MKKYKSLVFLYFSNVALPIEFDRLLTARVVRRFRKTAQGLEFTLFFVIVKSICRPITVLYASLIVATRSANVS